MKKCFSITHLMPAFLLFCTTGRAHAQVEFPPLVDQAIDTGISYRAAKVGQEVIFREKKSVQQRLDKGRQDLFESYLESGLRPDQRIILAYQDLEANIIKQLRLLSMDKSIYVQVGGGWLDALSEEERGLKNRIFQICINDGVVCNPYIDFFEKEKSDPDIENKTYERKPINTGSRHGSLLDQKEYDLHKVCIYDVQGNVKTLTISSAAMCPLSKRF